ncbi:MAG: hypothetical protein GX631_06565, partial [Dehalococcoidales bacterium]|nr:hypothetical protein [Dehalococcoidales bacterium]
MKLISNLKIGPKMIAGFLLVIVLAGVIGIVSINGLSSLNGAVDEVNTANEISQKALEARNYEKSYVNTQNVIYIDSVTQAMTELKANIDIIGGLGKSKQFGNQIIDDMYAEINEYAAASGLYVEMVNTNNSLLGELGVIGTGFDQVIAQIKSIAERGGEIYLQADKLETTFTLMRVAGVYFVHTPNEAKW